NMDKRIITIILFIFLAGCQSQFGADLVIDSLALKAPKEKILGSLNNGNITRYAYNSDVEIIDLPNEIKSLRTKYSRTYKNPSGSYSLEIIGGEPQYYKDKTGKWWQAEYGTTTKKIYEKEIGILPIISFIKSAFAYEDTFYPDPSAEVNSVDGIVRETTAGQTWVQLTGGTGDDAYDALTTMSVTWAEDVGADTWKEAQRMIILFDTSALSAGASVNSATLSIYGSVKQDPSNNAGDINIYASDPASNTVLAGGDYDSIGTTAFSTAITYDGWNIAGYNDFILNANGIAAIDVSGVSKFGARNANKDVAGSAPTWVNGTNEFRITGKTAETSGTTNDPKLVIDYDCYSCTFSTTFDTAGYNAWVAPTGVTSADVACIGAGGGGHDDVGAGGGGGGGGAFASSTVSVTPGVHYTVFIGSGGTEDTGGTDSTFGTTTVIADAGSSGTGLTGFPGGTTADSTGDVEKAGGTGGDGSSTNDVGGGGGGAAGPNGVGGTGENGNTVSGQGGLGGAGESGAGGVGGTRGNATDGGNGGNSTYGGGGGGGGDNSTGGGNGGNYGAGGGGGEECDNGTQCQGADGVCTVTYVTAAAPAAGGPTLEQQDVFWF
ncbi:MAG: glycine-rich domain-containing protein, partial [Candidatus Margulisiibacteriota bacterium]